MRVGIITCDAILPYVHSKETPLYTHDDFLWVEALRKRGGEDRPLPWRRSASFEGLDVAVIRSPWDYARDAEAFLSWLEGIPCPVWNGLELIRWNADKRYLLELQERGVPIVPTAYIHRGQACDLVALMQREGWSEIVVKPAIGAAGADTFRLDQEAAARHQRAFSKDSRGRDWLVQPFLVEILDQGEWSLSFVGDEYSHAVRKVAKEGEFRVQDDHGGAALVEEAPPWLQQQAQRVCEAIPYPWLYARVDGVVCEGQLLLMELEVIEPELFFRADPASPARFLDALEAKL